MVHNEKNKDTTGVIIIQVIGTYWGQSLWMTETFLFVRSGEGEVYRNVVWKLQKCHDEVGGDDVDMKPG